MANRFFKVGAAEALEKGSVLINPHDTVATAEALHTALSMPAKEARATSR